MENDPNTFSIRLVKRPPHGLGFLVRKRKCNPPVLISDLISGGVAENSGLVRIGDILLAVNGVQLTDVPYNTALEVLRSVPMDTPCVIVLKGPEGYRTRLETVMSPDGAVNIVRITEPEQTDETPNKTSPGIGPKKQRRSSRDSSRSPTRAPSSTWPRNAHLPNYENTIYNQAQLHNGIIVHGSHQPPRPRTHTPDNSPYRYGSPARRSRRDRDSSRSPARGSLPTSPVRNFSYREPSPCYCNRHGIPEYQNVFAWNGTYPRDVYQLKIMQQQQQQPHEEFYYDSPRTSVDYDLDGERARNQGMSLIEESHEYQSESKGIQCPERIITVRSPGFSSPEKETREIYVNFANGSRDHNEVKSEFHSESEPAGVQRSKTEVHDRQEFSQQTPPEEGTPLNANLLKEPLVNGIGPSNNSINGTITPDSKNLRVNGTLVNGIADGMGAGCSANGVVSVPEGVKQAGSYSINKNASTPIKQNRTNHININGKSNGVLIEPTPVHNVSTSEISIQTDPIPSPQENNSSNKNTESKQNGGSPPPSNGPTIAGPVCPFTKKQAKYVRLHNVADGKQFTDTLHQKAFIDLHCSEKKCMGSIMFPPREKRRSKDELTVHATDFINQYFTHIKRADTAAHKKRLAAVLDSIEKTGTYQLTETELILGAKTAWRNAPRCIGRIQWTKLQVFDARNASTPQEMFQAICNHMSYATNKGNLRSAITIFPQRGEKDKDFRVWNRQLLGYAGYKQPDGTIIGDPAGVEFTEVCQKLGWKGSGGRFDVLPLVLQANGEDPEMYDIPPSLILEVPLEHPKFPWFKDLGLKWYALPAVSSLMLDLGGLEFTACPFNGWYMVTEIGARDICDTNRLNLIENIGVQMGLDISTNATLWKDQALVEANVAVLYSYQKLNVTITDHHSASESFMKHMENEQRLRGGCPADWVWIVPPISGSITPVFHQEMLNYQLKPSYEYQDDPWHSHVWKNNAAGTENKPRRRKLLTFKEVAKAVKFSTKMMGKALAKRIKATILYATETGKSEKYAKTLCEIFKHAFDAKVMNMEEYDVANIEHESLLLVVTSTFGNGDPPENGEEFGNYLLELSRDGEGDGPSSLRSIRFDNKPNKPVHRASSMAKLDESSGILANVRFSVFGLGSRAYPHFCAYARTVDQLISNLGGERINPMGEGDELGGQEDAFRRWAKDVFKAACEVFCIKDGVNLVAASEALNKNENSWNPQRFRVSVGEEAALKSDELNAGLSVLHGKTVLPCLLTERMELQAKNSERSTIFVRLDTQGASELLYEPGDHVAICPANNKDLVDRVLKYIDCEYSMDTVIKVEFQQQKQTALGMFFDEDIEDGVIKAWHDTERLPKCSIREALTNYLDITIPPTPDFLRLLSTQATDKDEENALAVLGKGGSNYEVWKYEHSPNLPEVFEQFPSVKVSASFLLTELAILKARYYSISSSPKMFPGEIHATVAVVEYRVKGPRGPIHRGVCSSWMNDLDLKKPMPCFIRQAPTFHMPEDRAQPLIMVGPGTGIAPFRSFWQQRQIELRFTKPEAEDGRKILGDITLIFGCRGSKVDDIYQEEKAMATKERAIINNLTAYSREPNKKKVYVQDMMQQHGKMIYETICKSGGHFYVCGDVSMAADVGSRLELILAEQSDMSQEEAHDFVAKMKDTNRYHEDIFGVTIRTAEIQTKMERAARRAQVLITDSSNKLTPAVKPFENGNGTISARSTDDIRSLNKHARIYSSSLSISSCYKEENVGLTAPKSETPKGRRTTRRSITATVLMSDEELTNLRKMAEADEKTRKDMDNLSEGGIPNGNAAKH
ncbi:nitric oxide synthase, brain-like isoform X3 [Lytechinus variegatus]|uniref:nitric oxide synthase, brain-like isoform X3 n=1 Tax=Lytechinus variegatus TaxID=7654 RepID=UPI001BB11DA8|nr:nitric oxide synthase, brain-like isoform X3 [Lytechinus variegatus]